MEQQVAISGLAPQSDAPFQLHLTDAAAQMARTLMQREGLGEAAALRVRVSGGGCSGMQYHLNFDAAPPAEDLLPLPSGVRVAVDVESRPYLNGITIDYVHALTGAGFKFLNPNAERTCGCGSSFAVG